ncbi:T9SS type A sorting domain-containing protein [Kordia sp. YSTF-M3]|uniref:T9SS type A sorting domain-containing protein n=1 Tax=Kordia aestuariivivens TaxID=2759037 RepID=A0ABR7Q8F0_9FLAO|nr:T9SS type A sorting domain-containing protein [Kordia aestuariivivens]MBC8754839.1 T9SS type A sorting domain-containing protein [Kordia aestuariivivens]
MKKLVLLFIINCCFQMSASAQCGQTGIDSGVCYTNNGLHAIAVNIGSDSPTDLITVNFTAGSIEPIFDFIVVYSGPLGSGTGGTEIYNASQDSGSFAGLSFTATAPGEYLSIYVNADGSINCADSGGISAVYNTSCFAQCNQTGVDSGVCYNSTDGLQAIVVNLGTGNPTDVITVDFTAGSIEACCDEIVVYSGPLGSGTGGTEIYNASQGSGSFAGLSFTAAAPGEYLSIYVNANGSIDCSSSGNISPVYNTSCSVQCNQTGIDSGVCYNSTDGMQAIVVNIGADNPTDVITVDFTAGSIEACCDEIVVYSGIFGSGTAGTEIYNASQSSGSFAGLSFTSALGEYLSIYVNADSSADCTTEGNISPVYNISCITPSIGCGLTGVDSGVCYNSTDGMQAIVVNVGTGSLFDLITVDFTAGSIAPDFDEIVVYSGALGSGTGGTEIYNATQASSGTFAGLSFTAAAPDEYLSIYVNANGSGDCSTRGNISPVYNTSCITLPIGCNQTGADSGVCYNSTDGLQAIAVNIGTGNPFDLITVDFTAGSITPYYDEIVVYSGTFGSGTAGTEIYNAIHTSSTFAGLSFTAAAPGEYLSIYVNANGIIDCTTEGSVSPVFNTSCTTIPVIECSQTGIDSGVCYTNNGLQAIAVIGTGNPFDLITVDFIAGSIEPIFDFIVVYSGPLGSGTGGTEIYNASQISGTFAGLSFTAAASGEYLSIYVNANGFADCSSSGNISPVYNTSCPTLGIDAVRFDTSSLTIYPNPTSNFVTLKNPENIKLKNISIHDLTGRLIKTLDTTNVTNNVQIDLSDLSSNIYFLSAETEKSKTTFKVIKE